MQSLYRSRSTIVLFFLVLNFYFVGRSDGQSAAPTDRDRQKTNGDLQEIKEQLRSLQSQIQEIKELLGSQRAALPVGATRTAGTPPKLQEKVTLPFVPTQRLGGRSNQYVVIEFSDLQCPFCSYFHKNTFDRFNEDFVKSGKVQMMSVDFPLESHPASKRLAVANMCAGEQGKYWEMREALFGAPSYPEAPAMQKLMKDLALDQYRFATCVSSPASLAKVEQDADTARKAGIYSTPSFLVGKVQNGAVTGTVIVGALAADEFETKVGSILDSLREGKDELIPKAPPIGQE